MLARIVLQYLLIHLLSICAYCEEANVFQEAEAENRPIAALFLGGEKCLWSQKLTQDVLSSPHFIDRISGDAILWKVPTKDTALQQKYNIKEFPQILLLDPSGKEFARFGYSPLSVEGYLEEILSTIESFQEICIALEQKETAFCEKAWIELYVKAKRLSAACFSQVILERGLKREKGNFFHLEKFAQALQKHKPKHPQVIKMKTELLRRDPENKLGTHFKVALLEFQKTASKLKNKERLEKALKPLLQYIHRFGCQDRENLWKAEMAIAEFLFQKKSLPLAIQHMEAAYLAAPESAKTHIEETLSFMKRTP